MRCRRGFGCSRSVLFLLGPEGCDGFLTFPLKVFGGAVAATEALIALARLVVLKAVIAFHSHLLRLGPLASQCW